MNRDRTNIFSLLRGEQACPLNTTLPFDARGWAYLFLCLFFIPSLAVGQLAIRGETVYTMAGQPIKDGVLLVRGNKIERVGAASQVTIPAGYKVLSAKVVTPGLVDAHSVVGLAGIYNVPHDQMQLETSSPVQPELRAIDAYNPREALVEWVRNLGVTTTHTGPGPGALASGTTIVVKTVGNTVAEALVDSVGMVAITLGSSVSQNFRSPGTRSKSVAMIRSEFLKAQEYATKMKEKDPSKRPSRDLKMDVLAKVLSGEMKAMITAQTAVDIMAALRLQKEFGFKMVLDGAAEAYLVLDEIKKAGVPVILHPTMVRTGGDTRNASMETAAMLKKTGIPFALQSGFEGYVPKTRVVLFEAAIAAKNGLAFEDALAAVTIDAARIIGVDKRVGSLEAGKDADIVLFDGDPFEYTSHVCTVVVNGAVVSESCK
ncbi:MAG TPA: amidohydrolase family protein [Bacteroidota bacterium]|nr:amidohydrolase family protein [Bacteroidota bacterium]